MLYYILLCFCCMLKYVWAGTNGFTMGNPSATNLLQQSLFYYSVEHIFDMLMIEDNITFFVFVIYVQLNHWGKMLNVSENFKPGNCMMSITIS